MDLSFKKFRDDEVNTAGTKANLEKLAGEIADMNYTDFTKGTDFASLAKRYSQQGQKAMDDTIGKVAARTGGLASSYATAAGNQAYNEHMGKLEDAARALYDSQRQEKIDNLGISQSLYQQNYQEKRDEVADNQWQATFDRQGNQWNKQFDYNANKDSKQEAWNNAIAIWSTGGTIPSTLKDVLGLDNVTEAAYAMSYAPTDDGDKDFTRYIYTGKQDENENYLFQYGAGGKTFSFAPGVNPYTGNTNPDTKNGTFGNGYQPNNIKGEKLTKTGLTDVINGVTQNVWQTPDGTKWIWDGTQNKYLKYIDSDEEEPE